jgi:toxin-antitoxin system PIN domain toxin
VTPDVNVMIAAFRPDHPRHDVAREWLEQVRSSCAEGSASLTLLPMVVVGFLRLVTNPRIFVNPDSIDVAVTFVDVLIGSPGVDFHGNAAEWPLLREKLLGRRLKGNSVTDAWIAAATEALSEHLVTFDRDFKGLLPTRDLTVLETSR